MASTLETIPFNYNDTYTNVQNSFANLGYDTSEGSNTSQLITAMSYLVSMLNYNTAVNINENILPLARQWKNAAQDARAMGYEPSHKQSYQYLLTLQFTVSGSYTIPKYTPFTIGSYTYYYMGTQLDLPNVTAGQSIQVIVKEGTLYKYTDYSDTLQITTGTYTMADGSIIPQYFIDIPFVDVEENGIEVFATYYDNYGNLISGEQWLKSSSFMIDSDTTLNKEFIRLDNFDYSTPRIYFQLAGAGLGLRSGSLVQMNVLTSNGVNGIISDLSNTSAVSFNISNISVTEISLYAQGTDYESISSIQESAPLFRNSANRAVTINDYISICNRHATVKESIIWGGDDEYPKCPGHVWFSFLPSTNSRVFTSDVYNYNYTLSNNGTYTWDYTVPQTITNPAYDPVNNPNVPQTITNPAWTTQVSNVKGYFGNWFLTNGDIRSYEYNSDNILINPGVWDILDNYKIPTIQFHNRHPLYLDFSYDIQILKFNVKTSKADIFQGVFNIINDYFDGTNDSEQMEQYNSEYFDGSLNKRIDQNISDVSGFTTTTTPQLALSLLNVSMENNVSNYRDIFIPLNVPYLKYFDNNGYLLYENLPSIDTSNFLKYTIETDGNLFTDWSYVQSDISNSITQSNQTMIVAPIRVNQFLSMTGINNQTVFNIPSTSALEIFPDLPDATTPTYNKLIVTYYAGGNMNNGIQLTLGALTHGFTIGSPTQITLTGFNCNDGDVITFSIDRHAGRYFLFNSAKKYIILQLYVNAFGFNDETFSSLDTNAGLDTPKSYLTTIEDFYMFTTDTFYLTTNGYALVNQNQYNAVTGAVIKTVTTSLYDQTPLKMDLFLRTRHLNFNYPSNDFLLTENVIPRLNQVTFLQGV